jgi:Pyridoxamine 5'-phosphate oxidase
MDGPQADRPYVPEYGIPTTLDGLLPWSWARERLEEADTYWLASVRPEGRPHLMPTWGVWIDDRFWFEGGLNTRRARNIARDPAVVVSIERGRDVVIVEAVAERSLDPDPATVERLVTAFAKYRPTHGYTVDPDNWRTGGLWAARPTVVFGWSRYPDDATRWRFEPLSR